MNDIVERLRALDGIWHDGIWGEAAAVIERLRAIPKCDPKHCTFGNAPICIGKPIIQALAATGQWQSESGAAVIAADDLFCSDPYAEIEQLKEQIVVLRELRDCDQREIARLCEWNADMREALRLAIRSRWLSIDFDHNRTPEACAIRRVIMDAISKAGKP